MPISVEEFLNGNVNEGRILSKHLPDEIIKGVNPNPSTDRLSHFLAAMAPLQFQGLLERQKVSTAKGSELYTRQPSSLNFLYIKLNRG